MCGRVQDETYLQDAAQQRNDAVIVKDFKLWNNWTIGFKLTDTKRLTNTVSCIYNSSFAIFYTNLQDWKETLV